MTAVLAGSRQYGTYLTLVEVKQWLRYPNPTQPSSTDDANLQRVIDMACASVQNHINRPVGAQTFWERHDGWSGEYIILKETPFLELVSCIEWQSSGGPINLVESTPENPVDGIQINYATGRIMRTFAGYSWPRPFFPGSRNIEVTYKAGFNPIPGDLWMGTVELVSHWWVNTQQQSALRLPGESAKDEYEPEETSGAFAGIPYRVQAMIDPYRLPGVA